MYHLYQQQLQRAENEIQIFSGKFNELENKKINHYLQRIQSSDLNLCTLLH